MGQRTIEVTVERACASWGADEPQTPAYGIARVLQIDGVSVTGNGGSRVLTLIRGSRSATMAVADSDCIPVPPSLDDDTALLAVPVAAALNLWDRLYLELGEAAVYTGGSPFADLIGLVALWSGGLPVIRLDSRLDLIDKQPVSEQVECWSLSDPDEALGRLRVRLQDKPGAVAVDLSGRPEIIDLLFEALPRWGRLMLAGRCREPLTIDFYNNVHRKGLFLVTDIFEPTSVLGSKENHAFLSAAFRLLEDIGRAEACTKLIQSR